MLKANEPPEPRSPAFRIAGYVLLLIIIGALAVLYFRPFAVASPQLNLKQAAPQPAIPLAWPSSGEAAVGILGHGVLSTYGSQTERPTASTAKLIDALTVLKKYPLKPGQSGPMITLGATDEAIYNQYYTAGGSLALIKPGEQITEYQMLQGMMLPSANNMADSLAAWAFGSLAAYKTAAEQTISKLGLNSTKLGPDASGFNPSTVSTAHDLVLLGEAAMDNPVLSQIVGQSQATLPVAGTVYNVNSLLGADGIIGVKTGNSTQAGGVFVFASKYSLGAGHSVTVVGTVQGLDSLQAALNAAVPLLASAKQNIQLVTIAKAGQTVATYVTPWGSKASAMVESDASILTWNGEQSKVSDSLESVHAPKPTGQPVGSLTLQSSIDKVSVPVTLGRQLNSPSLFWRITRH